MEPAAGTFTDTRDSWPLQDGIKDSSSLHLVTSQIVWTRRALVMTLFYSCYGALEIVGAITIIIFFLVANS